MLVSQVVLALSAAALVAAAPASVRARANQPAFRPPNRAPAPNAFRAPPPPPKKVAPAKAAPAKKGAKVPKPYNRKNTGGKAPASTTTTVAVSTTNAAGQATTTTTTAVAANTNAVVNKQQDSGVTNVIQGCVNPDGVTECFQILGDLKNSCFTIPRPLANNVAFFLPPPNGTCSLFSDEDCKNNQEAALGVITNIAANSWSCVDSAAAAAAAASSSASAASTTAAAATTTTSAAANTAVASKNTPPPSTKPVRLPPAKSTPANKGSKMPKPYNKKNTGGTPPANNTAAVVNKAQDSGVTNVIEGCVNPDGVTECFEILGDLKNSCFSIPRPLANNVAFFLPPPNGTCALFSDENCKNDQEAALGVIKNIKANSWSCVDSAAAAAAAASSSASAASTTTSTAAANTAVAAKNTPPPSKKPVRLPPAKSTPANKGSKMPKPYNKKNNGGKAAASTTTTAVVTTTNAAGKATTTTTTAVAANTNAAVNKAQDSGVTNVIEGCVNPDGETECFEILGDLKNSCFTIPRPLANNVAFFLPPPNGTCALFSDENCKNDQEAALGVISNVKANSWSCVASAAAAAAAASSSASAASTTTSAAANTAVAAPPAKTTAPPSKKPVRLPPAKSTPAKKGSKVPKPYNKKNNGGKAAASTTTTAVVTTTNAAGSATTTTTTAVAANTNAAVNKAQDSGIKDVILGCVNPDGVTECFEILGDSKNSCFSIPRPLANNVAFFLPPPNDTCALFTDESCQNGQQAALGVISNIKANSWSCVPSATAAASASASATTTTTDAAANTNVATPPPVNTLTDTGITNVIEGCVNPDGVTECFEILGDTKNSCFTIPRPLANSVAFFLPPPAATCQLFTDENCTQGAQAALGQIANVKANSWSCTAAAAKA